MGRMLDFYTNSDIFKDKVNLDVIKFIDKVSNFPDKNRNSMGGLIMDMLLKDKKVCANCANEYQRNKNLGYDHYEPHRCKENNGEECSDVWNTTCYKFIRKIHINS